MAEWIRTLRGALLLDTGFYTYFDRRADVFLRGFILVAAVALIAGLPTYVVDTVRAFRGPMAEEAESAEVAAGMQSALDAMEPFLQNLPPAEREEIMLQVRAGFQVGLTVASQVNDLPTILPRPAGRVLRSLGDWLSRPFAGAGFPLSVASLSTWLGYGIWVMLAAKLLGGRGDVAGFLGATGLYAVPHLLNVFHEVPFLGSFLGFVAFVWGVAIYVKMTAISHELSVPRALLAVALPLLVLLLLAFLGLISFVTVIALVASGS